jgi:PqqD family protein of HPr-rel-A system
VLREVEDDVVAYDPLTDRTALLNDTSAFILARCDGAHSVGDIAHELATTYDVSTETASSDVESILARFRENGLLR